MVRRSGNGRSSCLPRPWGADCRNYYRDTFYAPFLPRLGYESLFDPANTSAAAAARRPHLEVSVGGGGGSGGPDRLSDLPDETFLHIISFLTAKSAARTAALAKRFRHLWPSSPALRFTQREFPDIPSFISFVDRVLDIHGEAPIATFELQWHHYFEPAKAAEWMRHAGSRGARSLRLSIPLGEMVNPSSPLRDAVFSQLPSTTNLILDGATSYNMSRPLLLYPSIPTSTKLKSLQLAGIDCSPQIGLLISACPALEDLMLRFEDLGDLIFSAPNLKSFALHYWYYSHDHEAKVRIDAPRLTSVRCHFKLCPPREFSLGRLSSLEDAVICTAGTNLREPDLNRMLGMFCNAMSLSLEGDAIQCLISQPHKPDHRQVQVQMPRLKYLKLEKLIERDDIQLALAILLKGQICAPNLERLVIHNSSSGDFPWEFVWLRTAATRVSSVQVDGEHLRRLKEISIIAFLGRDDDFELVEFLLRNAVNLEKLNIRIKEEKMNSEKWMLDQSQLLAIPRASPAATLSFSIIPPRPRNYDSI